MRGKKGLKALCFRESFHLRESEKTLIQKGSSARGYALDEQRGALFYYLTRIELALRSARREDICPSSLWGPALPGAVRRTLGVHGGECHFLDTIAVKVERRCDPRGATIVAESIHLGKTALERTIRSLVEAFDAWVDGCVCRIAIGVRDLIRLNCHLSARAYAIEPLDRRLEMTGLITIGIAISIFVGRTIKLHGVRVRLTIAPSIAVIVFPVATELGGSRVGERLVIIAVLRRLRLIGCEIALGAGAIVLSHGAQLEPVLAGFVLAIVIDFVAWMSIAIGIAPAFGEVGVDRLLDAGGFGRCGGGIAAIEGACGALIAVQRSLGRDAEFAKAGFDASLFTITKVAVLAVGIGRATEAAIVLAAVASVRIPIIAFFARRSVDVTIAAD